MKKSEKIVHLAVMILCELFTVATIMMLFARNMHNRLPLAFATLILILIPELVGQLFRCKISMPVYIFAVLYTMGPMLGQCHNLYYTVWWWDKLLHITGGVMFALFGFFLFEFLNKGNHSKVVVTAVFALCFSMAISVLWEFAEYSSDTFLGTDMQNDTLITSIDSYLLDEGVGVIGSIDNIEEVIVNGERLPVKGYIDIGLNDTMLDMLLETLGAVAAVIFYLIDKGKHPAFQMKRSGDNRV